MGTPEAIVKEVLKNLNIKDESYNNGYSAYVDTETKRINVGFGRIEHTIVVLVLHGRDLPSESAARTWREFKFDIRDPTSIQKARKKVLDLIWESGRERGVSNG